ncbi:MAG: hypothetical protein GTO63_19995 [Anaerolineae bacterium]|nr:hypothetical protein [Anaerolineae bacterium]NIN97062.1 hypothetical protein [Anaerolineae bacterium]NIQ80011.1 hypothetical protein [Anaerolineae bacterium]
MNVNPGQTGSNKRQLLITLLCCLLPVAALAAIWVLGVPLDSVLLFGIVLLCPLGHLFMMRAGHQHQEVGCRVDISSTPGDGRREKERET